MLNLDKTKTYLLACSYGPDSMALFDMLIKEKVLFEVAHVNYHLRNESNDEEASLRAYCDEKNIKIHVLDVQEKIESNIEARCRLIRYHFFSKLFKENKYEAVLVAHHQDDLIETYLLQKDRKNLVNYFGIAEKTIINNTPIVRPLLGYTKNDLLSYCDANKIPYSIDQTNLIPMYKRNKIRIEIVTKLTKEERMSILSEINGKNQELNAIFEKIDTVTNIIEDLLKLSDVELSYYLYRKVSAIESSYKLTHKCVKEVKQILLSNKPNITLLLGKKTKITKEYNRLIISKRDFSNGYSFSISNPCEIDNEFFYLNFLGDASNRNVKSDDYPLTIRTYQKGDRYYIKDYAVQVRRLYIDWKMPMSLRKRWPIIVNKDNRIIYIPRYRTDFHFEEVPNFYVK